MNAGPKELWIGALRSGSYAQGKNALHDDGCYCCLGVLCEVYREATGRGSWKYRGRYGNYFVVGESVSAAVPPKEVLEWAGLSEGMANALSDINDLKGQSFDQIADIVERKL